MSDVCRVYRDHLRASGYRFCSRRERVRFAALVTEVHTVTLTHPDGTVTEHQAQDRLYLAYRAACRSLPIGLPADSPGPEPLPRLL